MIGCGRTRSTIDFAAARTERSASAIPSDLRLALRSSSLAPRASCAIRISLKSDTAGLLEGAVSVSLPYIAQQRNLADNGGCVGSSEKLAAYRFATHPSTRAWRQPVDGFFAEVLDRFSFLHWVRATSSMKRFQNVLRGGWWLGTLTAT